MSTIELGRLILDAVLAVILVEAIALGAIYILALRKPSLAGLLRFLLAGALLVIACRLLLMDLLQPALAAFALAFVVHVLELRARWRPKSRSELAQI